MPRRNKTLTRYLLPALMLVVASVQADASYFCSMMDTVILDDCCCTDADFDEMTVSIMLQKYDAISIALKHAYEPSSLALDFF